jgi:hypothetical protein
MRWGILAAALLCAVAGSAPAARQALPRATADRPDEVRGPQVHAVYAVPSDLPDRELDTSGAIESSVASFGRWLAAETGGATFRFDTFEGSLDVTFVRLPRTDAEIAARGAFVRDELEQLLAAVGLADQDKLYAVYYDGSSTYACGGGAWPPVLRGRVTAMYLRAAGCPGTLAAAGAPPGYTDYAMLHELFHTLGAVPACAPHHHRAGHTTEPQDDLMWAGTGTWPVPGRLDPGRDDYYGHGRADCPDVARSEYLTSNPPPAPKLVAGRLTLGIARAGRQLTASVPVTLGDAAPSAGRARCTLRIGGRRVATGSSAFAAGRASCRWKLPTASRGRRAAGSVGATVDRATVSRSFTIRVR